MKRCILYAEDDEEDFMLMKKAFEDIDEDVEVVNAPTGYDVIKFLQDSDENNYPSVILLELNLRMLDGKETLEFLQLDDKYKNIPVVLFASAPSPADEAFIVKSGLKFIQKPSLYSEWLNIARKLTVYYCVVLFGSCDVLLLGW